MVGRIPCREPLGVHVLMGGSCSWAPGKARRDAEHPREVRLEWWVGCSEALRLERNRLEVLFADLTRVQKIT